MPNEFEKTYTYDVALSFAREDRSYVETVAASLRDNGVKVFYDGFETISLWGKNLNQQLSKVYGEESLFTVIFISEHYEKNMWANHELREAQARAIRERTEYILPVRFDDHKIPGIPSDLGYLDIKNMLPETLAVYIKRKIRKALNIDAYEEASPPVRKFKFDFPIFYSVQAKLSLEVNEQFYNNLHYFWASPFFNSRSVPPSSNPFDIYKRLDQETKLFDNHGSAIMSIRSGIIRGARIKLKEKAISNDYFEKIVGLVKKASFGDFKPSLCIIPTSEIDAEVTEVPLSLRGGNAVEFRLDMVHGSLFDTIQY